MRFLTSVVINDNAPKRNWKLCEAQSNETPDSKYVLIISGGDGFEDFRNTGTNTVNEVAGREDSTNHLLMWQQML